MSFPSPTSAEPDTSVTPAIARVVEVTAFGGPDVLRMRSIPRPEAAPGRVRVAVGASTVDLIDILARSGAFASLLPDLKPPFVVGSELAGTLLDSADDLPAGTRVVSMIPWIAVGGRTGAYADVVAVDPTWLARTPDNVDDITAATLPGNGLAARQALDLLGVTSGQRILVTGASGSVGAYGVALAKLAGAQVVAQASSGDEAFVAKLGADEVLPQSDAATLAERVGTVDAVLDAALLGSDLLPAVRDGGAFAILMGDAFASDRVRVKRLYSAPNPEQLSSLAELLGAGKLRTRVADVFPLEAAAQAHHRFAAGSLRGRLVLSNAA